jgi:serine/threonine protein kinase
MLNGKELVLEYINGDSYRHHQHELNDRDLFFARLLKTLQDIHAAGVAHGDLKRKDNLLVGPDERPFIIDFGLASIRHTPAKRLNRFYFDWKKKYDYNAWIKHKYQGRLELIAAEDLCYNRPMKLEQIARGIRVVWQKITLRRFRTRHR